MKDPYNVIITGVGGQGNVLASQLLGQCLVEAGFQITIGETYGASQRGGSVMSHIRVSREALWSPIIPRNEADLVVGLEPLESLRVLAQYGNPEVLVMTNTRPIYPLDVIAGKDVYPPVDNILRRIAELSSRVWTINAAEIALQLGNTLFSNMVMIGALASLDMEPLPLKREKFLDVLRMLTDGKMVDRNLEAFDRGARSITEHH